MRYGCTVQGRTFVRYGGGGVSSMQRKTMRETERFVVFDRYGAKHTVRVLRQFAEKASPDGVRVVPTSEVVLQLANADLLASEGGSAVRIVRIGEVLRRPSLALNLTSPCWAWPRSRRTPVPPGLPRSMSYDQSPTMAPA